MQENLPVPEPSSNLYTPEQISKQLSIPLDDLQAILDFYPTRNFPSFTVGSTTLYTEQALENISSLRSLEETRLAGRQPVEDPAGLPKAGAVRRVSEEATRRRIAAAKEKKRVDEREANRPPEKLRTKEPSTHENLNKSGRRKRPARKAAKDEAAPGLLPLAEISRRTGISYPTLVRYVKLHGNKIPSTGSGRKRRYSPEAIAVFKEIRSQSKRGPKPARRAAKAARPQARRATAADQELAARIRALEDSQQRLAKQLANLITELKRPILVTSGG